MKNSLYNRTHIWEYLIYGLFSAIVFIIPVWIYLYQADYEKTWFVFSGSIFFMFVIMAYAWKLCKRRPDYKSTWMMIMASHLAVFTGILFSVIFTTILCFIYIPDFLSAHSENVFGNAPTGVNNHNFNSISLLYVCATVENYGAGGFIGALAPYVFKRNQTKDRTAVLDPDLRNPKP